MAKNKVKTTRCPECNSTSTYMRLVRSPGIVCRNCGKFFSREKGKRKKAVMSSSGECPSCGGLVENGKCETCHARKFQETFVFEEKKEKKEKKTEDRADRADRESYVCECGEKVLIIEENIKRSIWDSVEWIICPHCGDRRKREGMNDECE